MEYLEKSTFLRWNLQNRSSETHTLSRIILYTLYTSLGFFLVLNTDSLACPILVGPFVLLIRKLYFSINNCFHNMLLLEFPKEFPIFIEGMIIKDISKNNKYSVNWQLKYVSSISAENWGTQTCVSLWERVQRPPMCVSWWSIVQRGRWQTSSWMTTSHSRGPSGSHLPLTSQTEWTTSTAMDSSTLDWTPVIAWWTIDGRWKLQVRHWGRRESDLIGAD